MGLTSSEQVFRASTKAAEEVIAQFPKLGLSIEYDKRGKHPAMTIRILPAIRVISSEQNKNPRPSPKGESS